MHPSIVIHFLIELNKMDAIKRGELEEEGKQYSSSYHQQQHRDGVIYCNPCKTVRDCTWLTNGHDYQCFRRLTQIGHYPQSHQSLSTVFILFLTWH